MTTSRFSGLLLALALPCLLLSACSKLDSSRLPDETTEGKNTFGCRLNGSAWVSHTKHTLDRDIEPEYGPDGFTVQAEREDAGGEDEIMLSVGDTSGLKTVTYGETTGFTASYINYENGAYEGTYYFQTGNGGSLTFTSIQPGPAGEYKAIVSGRFSFTATSEKGKTVTVTDGRFDVKVH